MESKAEKMDFDDVTRKLGQFGKYQRRIFFLVCLVGFPVAFHIMSIVFVAASPDHWCHSPDIAHLNLTDDVMKIVTLPPLNKDGVQVFSSCSRYVYAKPYSGWTADDVTAALGSDRGNITTEACPAGWRYDTSVYTSTIVTQWDLVCDAKWLRATASSVYMAGLMAGVFIISAVSDMFGRKKAFICSLLGTAIFSISTSFAPNYITFCVLRAITAFFNIGIFTTGFVIGMELIGPDWRPHAGIIIEYFWVGGYLLVAVLAYFLRGWFTLTITGTSIMALTVLLIFVIPESPRWLYAQGRAEEAEAIIRKAAKVNEVDLPDPLNIAIKSTKKGYVWDLCRTPRMAIRSSNVFFNWFVNSCVYYGLSLNTSNLGGNDFVNFSISAGVEIPAYIFCQVALHYVGRRWPLCGTMVVGGVALLSIAAVPYHLNWLAIALAMFGKFCISASFGIIYVFTAEMYPTPLRNLGVGTGSLFARGGGILAPYIGQLSDYNKIIPLIIFGLLSLVAGLLALIFPETKGQDLPETLEDGENLGKKPAVGETNDAFVVDKTEL